MRTLASTLMVLLVVGSGQAFAQPTPTRLDASAEAALRADVKRHELEYTRYDEGATDLEGAWTVAGTRTVNAVGTAYSGELSFARQADGTLKVTGKVVLAGRTAGKWEGKLTKTAASTASGAYKSTIGGEGTIQLTPGAGGALRMAWRTTTGPAQSGEGTLTRAVTLDRAALETRLFELNARLQAHRYPRPTPVRYRTATRKTELVFTPTVEHDPNGVENQVIGLIDRATTSLDLAVFEFSLPRVAQALVRAKARGVRVRMVYDSREEEQPAIQMLKRAEVTIRGDQRASYMHNKFMVVDGRMVWTGSTNLAPGGIYVADNNAISFKHPGLAAEFTKEFEEMFVDGKFGPTSPKNTNLDWMVVDTGVKLQVRFAPEDSCMARVIEAVRGARRSIKFVAFAFTSKSLFEAMVERINAGVRVEGIFESRHAGWADIKIGPLNKAGATVRFDENPNALHHKVIIIDDKVVCTGSFNFSDGADTSNDENLLVIDSATLGRAFAREFTSLMSTTDPTDPRIATSGMGGGTPSPPDGTEEAERPTTGLTESVPGQ